ncbi:MAG: rod-binding protein [Spirochaetota bacterium]|nr:rod-binding protein [Spirochaetota bacterium]
MKPIDGQLNFTKDIMQLNQAKANAERAKRFQNTLKSALSQNSPKSNNELMEVCYQFESLMIKQMFKSMKSTLDSKNSLLHGGQAEEIFDDMLLNERSLSAAKSSGFGLAQKLYDEMSQKTISPQELAKAE